MDGVFWKDKKVFITGHTGFKGSWLSLWLQSQGANVCGYALPPAAEPNIFTLAEVESGMQSIVGDICHYEPLSAAIDSFEPDIVFHMAAQSLVRKSYQLPIETYATNIMGTANLLEAVRKSSSTRVVVNITTDKCYENQETQAGYVESDVLGGDDPYSSSKACAELISNAYRKSFLNEQNILLATVRAGNVIGGGDWAEDRLIPDLIRSFMSGQPAVIRNPNAIRPWQHVLDPLCGYMLLAESLWNERSYAGAWNFGPEQQDSKPVSWVVDCMAKHWGETASWELDTARNPHESMILRLDSTKANKRLGWKPVLNLETALNSTVEWYKSYRNGCNMRHVSLQQIADYETLKSKNDAGVDTGLAGILQ